MKIAVIGKSIRKSRVSSFIKGMFEKVNVPIKCEICEFENLETNIKYLKKMDGVIVLNSFNEEIAEEFNSQFDHVSLVRLINDEHITYDLSDYITEFTKDKPLEFVDYYTALFSFRVLYGLMDFEMPESFEILSHLIDIKMSDERLTHSLAVCKFAKEINKMNDLGIDEGIVEITALLHDISKEERISDDLIEKFDLNEIPKTVWHSIVGALRAEELFGITDKEILDAIKYHTTGRGDMTLLDEIINLADFAEPTRTYSDCIDARELAFTDYKKALAIKFKRLMEYRSETLTKDNIDAYNKYKEYL